MRRITLAPQSTRTGTRPVMIATGLAAVLFLSACGGGGDTTADEQSATQSPSASVSATPSASPSESASETASESPSESPSPEPTESAAEASETSEDAAVAAPEETAAAPEGPAAPEPERTASAPELGMPPATPFTPPATDGQSKPGAQAGACSVSQLSGNVTPNQGAAGSVLASVNLTNTGNEPCVLHGYPGVSFVDQNGGTVGAPAARDGALAGTAVTLQPGQSASAPLKITQPGAIGQLCNPQQADGFRVYPPGSHQSLLLSYPGEACGNPKIDQLQVRGFGS